MTKREKPIINTWDWPESYLFTETEVNCRLSENRKS